MSHWILRAVAKAGLGDTSGVDVAADASPAEAWRVIESALEVTSDEVAGAVAKAFSMEVAVLESAEATAERLLTGPIARKFGVFPLRDEDRYLLVATSNPVDPEAEQEVAFASGRSARFAIAPPGPIAEAIASAYSPDIAAASLLAHVDEEMGETGDVELDSGMDDGPEEISEAEIASGPIVRLTNIVLHEAIARGASDIHIQPMARGGLVRFRSDGVLHNGMQMPLPVLTRIVSRIKIIARLDITDRLRPQDGRARISVGGKKYDLRVSTVPTRRAEKAVIRILDTQGAGTLVETGIDPVQIERIRSALTHRDGILVVTGPTGSGKTTTLYGALREISTEDVNIMTVEDPVEYELPRLTQIQVEKKQGVTFASALRAILRQDPDVIFVGEIRDGETAEIAAQASLTGHLVLATLHTNNAIGAIRRFFDLGLDLGTVGETLRGVLAQRLVRKICHHCAEEVGDDLTPEEAGLSAKFGAKPVVRQKGCDRCVGQGYLGRLPVTEFMVSTPAFVRLMLAGAAPFELQSQAVRDGMIPMVNSALARVAAGETTLQEVERVVGAVESSQEEAAMPVVVASPEETLTVSDSAPPVDPIRVVSPPADPIPIASPPPEAVGAAVPRLPATPELVDAPPIEVTPEPEPEPEPEMDPEPEPEPEPEMDPILDSLEADDEVPHVLLVDDDRVTRTFVRSLIEKLEFRATESADGDEALLRLARGEHFTLMVLDLQMPTPGGRAVLKAVRQSIATAGLPVIVLTGSVDQNAEKELMELGADDYLRKPIDPEVFRARVQAAIRRAQA